MGGVGGSAGGVLGQVGRGVGGRRPMAGGLAATVSRSWVWRCQPLSFVCAAVLTWGFAMRLMNKLKDELDGAPLRPRAETEARR